MRAAAIAGFLVAVLPLVVTPGASLTLLVQQVTTKGRRRALPVITGTTTGLYIHATLAAAGLSAVVMRSSQAFAVVRLVGAAYIVGLGIWTWRAAGRPSAERAEVRRRRLPWAGESIYLRALLGNVLNPKAASIFLTLTPQFIDPRHSVAGQILILASADAVVVTLWLLTWTVLIGGTARAMRSARFKTVLNRVTAVVLVALGLRTATT
jgi:threonine/homoserine/homoserine lactone efflux protein